MNNPWHSVITNTKTQSNFHPLNFPSEVIQDGFKRKKTSVTNRHVYENYTIVTCKM